jgi:hypothetical protein
MLNETRKAQLLAAFSLENRPIDLLVPLDLETCVARLRKNFDPPPNRFAPIDLARFRSLDDNSYHFILQAYRYKQDVLLIATMKRQDAQHTRIIGQTAITRFGLMTLGGMVVTASAYTIFTAITPLLWLTALIAVVLVALYWVFLRYTRRRIIRELNTAMMDGVKNGNT